MLESGRQLILGLPKRCHFLPISGPQAHVRPVGATKQVEPSSRQGKRPLPVLGWARLPPARSFITRSEAAPKYTACPPLSSLNKLLQQQETQLTTQTLLTRLFYYFDPVTERGADKSPTSGFITETLDSRSISRVCARPLLSQAVILSFFLLFYLFLSGSRPGRTTMRSTLGGRKRSPRLDAWAVIVPHLCRGPAAHNNRRQIPRRHK